MYRRKSLLGLGEEVGEEDLVVLAARDWVESLDGGEEITGSQQSHSQTGDTHQGMSLVPWWMSW